MSAKPSQWDNRVFTFCYDLVGAATTTVEINTDIFDATQDNEIRLATDAFMKEVFETYASIKMMGLFDSDNDRMEMVRVQNTVNVSPPHGNYLLREDLAPREAYRQVNELIRND